MLFKTSPLIKKCNAYLLFSSEDHFGGGANIDKKSVSLEISHLPLKNINNAMAIIWHEIVHLLFQNDHLDLMLMKILKDRKKAKIVNEAVIASLFPRGILGKFFFKTKLIEKLHSKISSDQTKKILNLTEKYVNEKKPFDESYIRKVADILNLNEKK